MMRRYEPFLLGAGTNLPLVARTITPHIKPSYLIVEAGTLERAAIHHEQRFVRKVCAATTWSR